jgi:2-polyprenyl-3-methyl-5-hydroxy-6-metoxy-1,4-benzoquinol methylase
MKFLEIDEILADPNTGEKLFKYGDFFLNDKAKRKYRILNDIPLLLPKQSIDNRLSGDYIRHFIVEGEKFDHFSDLGSEKKFAETNRNHEFILKLIPDEPCSVLDAGSGNSWLAGELCPRGYDVCSFDLSLVNTSHSLNIYNFDNHCAVVGDVLQIPFLKETFDVVVASGIAELVVKPYLMARNLFDLVKPGGRMIIFTTYNKFIKHEVCIHCDKLTPREGHLHTYTDEKMCELLECSRDESFKLFHFGNKFLKDSGIIDWFEFLPYGIWKAIDSFSNKFIGQPGFIAAVYSKEAQ